MFTKQASSSLQPLLIPDRLPGFIGRSHYSPHSSPFLPLCFLGIPRRRTDAADHLLDKRRAHHLSALAHAERHVGQQGRVADVGGVRVADNVVGPFVACGVGVAGADVFLLEVLELLEGAQLVGHDGDGDDGHSDVGGGIEQVVVSG